jgi:hypothetical protein
MMMMMMSDYKSTVPTNSFCQNLKQFDAKVSKESKSLDNLMNSLYLLQRCQDETSVEFGSTRRLSSG